MSDEIMQLHVISTGAEPLDQFCRKAVQLAPYVTAIHLRERKASAMELLHVCERLMDEGVPSHKVIINDRVDVVAVAAVKGVQLAWHSLPVQSVRTLFPQLVVGKSVHSCDEARHAEEMGCDYVLFGHIFSSNSKQGVPPRGLDELRQVVRSVQVPVIAIGGIEPRHVEAIAETGAAGIAVMSGILEAQDCISAAQQYVEAIKAMK